MLSRMDDVQVIKEAPVCMSCGARFGGDRTAARRAQWEPYSTSSQRAVDYGPMICPDCVTQLLDDVLDALRKH